MSNAKASTRSFTLLNTFHGTEAVVIPRPDPSGVATLTRSQVRRAERKLCGMSDCSCGGEASVMGGRFWLDWTDGPYADHPGYWTLHDGSVGLLDDDAVRIQL